MLYALLTPLRTLSNTGHAFNTVDTSIPSTLSRYAHSQHHTRINTTNTFMMRTLFISIYILHNHAHSHNSAHSHTMHTIRTTNTSMLHTDDCNCKCEHVLHTPYNTLHWLEIQCYEYTYSRWLPAKVTIIPLNNAFVLH